MQIHITEAAERELMRRTEGKRTLKLMYDAEGCGCAVNGLAQLWVVPSAVTAADNVRNAVTNTLPVVYEKQHEIFFDDRLTLDYEPKYLSFILRSDGQIFNPRMALTDKRNGETIHDHYQ